MIIITGRRWYTFTARLISIAIFVLTSAGFDNVDHLNLLTPKEQHFLERVDQATTLQCEFFADKFNLFDNPIVWRKRQLHEETQINMLGNILEPFASTKRFRATYSRNESSKYLFQLWIGDLKPEDSGNYTCEISGALNSIRASVSYRLSIRGKVDQLVITLTNNDQHTKSFSSSLISSSSSLSSSSSSSTEHDHQKLILIEDQSSVLQCTAFGGFPGPAVDIYLAGQNLNEDTRFNQSVTLSGKRGLRLMRYTTTAWSPSFKARKDDDGKMIKCVTYVDGMEPRSTSAVISVHYIEIMFCENRTARVGERNVVIVCELRARPRWTDIYWVVDDNLTVVREASSVKDFWTIVNERMDDDVIEAQLFFRQVKETHFRKFTLVAENVVASKRKEASLLRTSSTVYFSNPKRNSEPRSPPIQEYRSQFPNFKAPAQPRSSASKLDSSFTNRCWHFISLFVVLIILFACQARRIRSSV